jgi:two-component system response regulator MtrA
MDERVLLVEDDPSIREVAGLGLSQAGFRVTTSGDGRDGLVQFRNQRFDLVVLDIMLPELDGYEVCRQIRVETVDVVVGLELGADDYVTKPFELPELVARARAALRRASAVPEDPVLSRGDLEIDPAAFAARKHGEEINLTATEFRLLFELARRPGQVFTRELLLERVWNYEYLGDSRLVDVAVQRLRAKVEDDPKEPKHIKTVRGVGYRFDVE